MALTLACRLIVAGSLVLPWCVVGLSPQARGATADIDPLVAPEFTSSIRPLPDGIFDVIAELEMRFAPAADGKDGHISVILTPQNRALSAHEARQAAEDAFLEALNEPGLGAMLTQVRVVVYFKPAPKPQSDRKAFVFSSENGVSWHLEAAESFKLVE